MPRPYYGYTGACSESDCCFSEAAVHLRDCFRLLWAQHIYWTRMVILGIAFDSPDLEPTTNRLLRNPSDFARVFCRFYGNEIASEVDRLITDHLVIAVDLVKAAKAGDSKAAAEAERKWYENADEIVCFLSRINPYWCLEHMRDLWYKHLSLTKKEAVATLNKNYTRSIELFDKIENEAMLMADDFSNGIICQFGL